MRTSAAKVDHSGERVLFLVFELSSKSWTLGFATDLGFGFARGQAKGRLLSRAGGSTTRAREGSEPG